MNNDQKLNNMSETDFRDLEAAPLQNSPISEPQIPAALSNALNDDALETSIDNDILSADLDDVAPIDLDADLLNDAPTGEGYTEVLESDLNQELSDGGPSHGHIHTPDMIASDTPGEIDIEDMEESDLEGTGIPADALLDPLED